MNDEMIDAMTCESDVEYFKRTVPVNWMLVSPKLDGVRTLMRDIDGQVSAWSRNKKPFPNFSRFYNDIVAMADMVRYLCDIPSSWPVWFDGEVVSKDREFRSVMQQLRRHKSIDPDVFEYHVFDCPTVHHRCLETRLNIVKTVIGRFAPKDIHYLRHYTVSSWADVVRTFNDEVEYGGEGVVVKNSRSEYTFKRSRDWLKMKAEHTLDLPVVGYVTGKGKYEGMLGTLTCKYKDQFVEVSGMTDAQRIEFAANLPDVIEVKHNGETPSGSLRHPRFVRVREDK